MNINPWFITGICDGVTKYSYSTNTKTNNSNTSTALIVWGDHMSPGWSKGRLSTTIQSLYSFTFFQLSVLIGLLLSDGWFNLASAHSKNARLGFSQSFNDKFEYFWMVANIFSPFISNFPYLRVRSRIKGSNKYQSCLEFYTRALPCFTFFICFILIMLK